MFYYFNSFIIATEQTKINHTVSLLGKVHELLQGVDRL